MTMGREKAHYNSHTIISDGNQRLPAIVFDR